MSSDGAVDEGELAEEARRLFAGRVDFLLSAPSLDFLPEADFPEVAFAGRSNVGKSSLINAVTGRKAIARTSVTPGRTQELNFFEVGTPTRFRPRTSSSGRSLVPARKRRSFSGFTPLSATSLGVTSTMRARPRGSRWVSPRSGMPTH